MNRLKTKTITLPVLPGVSPEWIRMQRREMVKRIIEEAPSDVPFKVTKQWSDKAGGRWMTVLIEFPSYEESKI